MLQASVREHICGNSLGLTEGKQSQIAMGQALGPVLAALTRIAKVNDGKAE